MTQQDVREAFAGVLLGTAVGDALGLPAENLSPEQIRRRWKGEWRMRLWFGRGMISDDTEHTLMVAHALLCHPQPWNKSPRNSPNRPTAKRGGAAAPFGVTATMKNQQTDAQRA